jgi:hypothetical protein
VTPDELRVAQNEVMRPPVAATLVVLRQLPAGPLAPGVWAKLVAALFPGVVTARRQSVALARTYYASQNPKGTAPRVPEDVYAPAMLSKTLERFARPGLELPETAPKAAVHGAAAVGRHVDQAGREFVAKASSADDIRFARYDPYGETCAFCKLLISRGPVYLSQTSGAFQSHPQCTCVAVPVFDEGDWPGREQYLEAEQQYVETTAGLSGKEAIAAFRRAVEG